MTESGQSKLRRERARKQRTDQTTSWWRTLGARVVSWPFLFGAVFSVVTISVTLYGEQSPRYAVGQRISHAIRSRVDFSWVNAAATEQKRQDARAATPNHYAVNHKLIDDICRSIQELYQAARAADSFESFAESVDAKTWPADQSLYEGLRSYIDEEGAETFSRWVASLRSLLASRYTYRPADGEKRLPASTALSVVILPSATSTVAVDQTGPTEPAVAEPTVVSKERLLPISSAAVVETLASELANRAGFGNPAIRKAVVDRLTARLAAEPILQFAAEATTEAMDQAALQTPQEVIAFNRGQSIVSPTQNAEEMALEPMHLALLAAEEENYQALLQSDDPATANLRREWYLERAGTALIILILSVGLLIHVKLYRPRIFEVRAQSMAFGLLVVGMMLVARAINLKWQYVELTLLPSLILAACMTIAHPRRFAMGTTGMAALMLTLAVRGDLALFVTLLVGLSLTVYLLNSIRSRTQIITASAVTALVVFVVSVAFGLTEKQALDYVLTRSLVAGGCVLGAGLIVQGILPFIERVFRIATSLTLLEYSSADRPLLQRLAREAPGTYNHSLVVANIGETACNEIGANGLLFRVGALYHDIGKIYKAEYFAENQAASINRHDKLSASMSLLIIVGHVKDGVELAREYGLPKVLFPFIEEHHGTTLVRYFHHKAAENQPKIASGKHDREVSEAGFRYPGPRPRSKETAVLMICDGVEGAVRALSEPTPGRIEAQVHQIISDRLNDGQFGICDITLRELQVVEASLVKSLCTFYHGRVAYPKASEKDHGNGDAPAEEETRAPARKEASTGRRQPA